MKRFKPVKHLYTNEVYMRESDEGLYVLFQDASDLELVLRERIEELEKIIAMHDLLKQEPTPAEIEQHLRDTIQKKIWVSYEEE